MSWFDTPINTSNFFRWSDAEGRSLADIQRPDLYELGVKSNSAFQQNTKESYDNKNNFFRWVDMNNIFLYQLQELGELPTPKKVTDLAGTASGTEITLTWTPNPGAVYSVYRRANTINGPYTVFGSSQQRVLPPHVVSASIIANTTYYFKIQEIVGNSAGLFSNIAKVTTGAAIPTTWSETGTPFSLSTTSFPAISALSSTRIAFMDTTIGELRAYDWDGSTWSLTGSGLIKSGNPALCALSSTDIAFINSADDDLTTYRFNGSTWSQVGNQLLNIGGGNPSLGKLTSSTVAFIDSTNQELRTYSWDGTDWSLVGNPLTITGIINPSIAVLSSTRIAICDGGNDDLQAYDWDGTDWTTVGNIFNNIHSGGSVSIVALESTKIALKANDGNTLEVYEFDGTNWASYGNNYTGASIKVPAITLLDTNQIASVNISGDDELATYNYT